MKYTNEEELNKEVKRQMRYIMARVVYIFVGGLIILASTSVPIELWANAPAYLSASGSIVLILGTLGFCFGLAGLFIEYLNTIDW